MPTPDLDEATPRGMPWRRLAVLGLVSVAATLGGCATTPIAPTYSKEELKAMCERQGGWWRPNILDGYCEGNSQI